MGNYVCICMYVCNDELCMYVMLFGNKGNFSNKFYLMLQAAPRHFEYHVIYFFGIEFVMPSDTLDPCIATCNTGYI